MCHVFKISKIRRQYYLENETKIVEIREYNVGDKLIFNNFLSIAAKLLIKIIRSKRVNFGH